MSNEPVIKLIKPFRVSPNEVKALFFHLERKQEFLLTYSNIHPGTGELMSNYDICLKCLSASEELNNIVIEAIELDLDLCMEIHDNFHPCECEGFDEENDHDDSHDLGMEI